MGVGVRKCVCHILPWSSWVRTACVCVYDADEAEGRLVQLVQREWVGGSLAARSQFARAGMAVLTQLWEAERPSSHTRLHSHLDATILEEVGCYLCHQPCAS